METTASRDVDCVKSGRRAATMIMAVTATAGIITQTNDRRILLAASGSITAL